MKPTKFKGFNATFAKDQPQYQQLPAFIDPGPEGAVTSCWKLSASERIKVLLSGKIWVRLMMFRKHDGSLNPLTPQYITANKSDAVSVSVGPVQSAQDYISESYSVQLMTDAGFGDQFIKTVNECLFPKP